MSKTYLAKAPKDRVVPIQQKILELLDELPLPLPPAYRRVRAMLQSAGLGILPGSRYRVVEAAAMDLSDAAIVLRQHGYTDRAKIIDGLVDSTRNLLHDLDVTEGCDE